MLHLKKTNQFLVLFDLNCVVLVHTLAHMIYTTYTQTNKQTNKHTHIKKHPLWQYGLWSFQTGGKKLERFLHKNEHIQRKLLNFENWVKFV